MNVYYREQLESIKFSLNKGNISYNLAKKQAKPIITKMNQKSSQIAKKYNQNPTKFSFAGLMR